jgi:hypothetical protein
MGIEIVTKEDLENFGKRLMNEIKMIFSPLTRDNDKKWIKGREVRKMLNISSNTLQAMRIQENIRISRIGGLIYYSVEDIQKVLEKNAVKP